jgi:hypothetical protein
MNQTGRIRVVEYEEDSPLVSAISLVTVPIVSTARTTTPTASTVKEKRHRSRSVSVNTRLRKKTVAFGRTVNVSQTVEVGYYVLSSHFMRKKDEEEKFHIC